MSKYDNLFKYIVKHQSKELTFDQIKDICGFEIDHSFLSCKKELLDYGYTIKKISLKDKKILIDKYQGNK